MQGYYRAHGISASCGTDSGRGSGRQGISDGKGRGGVSVDPTRISMTADPQQRILSGVTMHGGIQFNVPFISEIAPDLWQGGCTNGLILPGTFTHIVSLYPWEGYTLQHELESVVAVMMYDSLEQELDRISILAAWVNACRKSGPVLVHCQAGLNRSSLVVASALMLEGMPAEKAIALIREKRSAACLCNPAFEEWLMSRPVARTPASAKSAARLEMEAEPCTRCGAGEGKPCRSKSGAVTSWPHITRKYAVLRKRAAAEPVPA